VKPRLQLEMELADAAQADAPQTPTLAALQELQERLRVAEQETTKALAGCEAGDEESDDVTDNT
jgi:hypothetical protein